MKSDAQSHLVVFVDDLVAFWVFLFVSVLALFIILSHIRVPRKLHWKKIIETQFGKNLVFTWFYKNVLFIQPDLVFLQTIQVFKTYMKTNIGFSFVKLGFCWFLDTKNKPM